MEATDTVTVMDTPHATTTPHTRTGARMDTGGGTTPSPIISMLIATDMATEVTDKATTRVRVEEVTCTREPRWRRPAMDIEAARIDTERIAMIA